jgi:hypothetical protein
MITVLGCGQPTCALGSSASAKLDSRDALEQLRALPSFTPLRRAIYALLPLTPPSRRSPAYMTRYTSPSLTDFYVLLYAPFFRTTSWHPINRASSSTVLLSSRLDKVSYMLNVRSASQKYAHTFGSLLQIHCIDKCKV